MLWVARLRALPRARASALAYIRLHQSGLDYLQFFRDMVRQTKSTCQLEIADRSIKYPRDGAVQRR